MRYLEHEKYKGMGGTADLSVFNRYEYKARMEVDRATFNRFHDEPIPTQLEMLMFELVEYLKEKSVDVVASRSQSQGGVSESESYDTAVSTTDELIRIYLAEVEVNGVPVLYRGCGGD